jgi:hypothetical protein
MLVSPSSDHPKLISDQANSGLPLTFRNGRDGRSGKGTSRSPPEKTISFLVFPVFSV